MRQDIDKQQIISDYLDGKNINYITKKYAVSLWFVYHTLDKHNIPRKTKLSGLTIDTLNRELVLSLYGNGQSATKIAKQLGCSHTLILYFLNKNGIAKTDPNQLKRKYKKIKEDYFDVIDTQEKAYYLGLLFADGCVQKSSVATINLQEEDKEILEKFSIAVFGENALNFRDLSKRNKKNQWVLNFCSKRMCKQLESIGCVTAKSLILKWPQWLIDPALQRHFIRGYFDGDGTINCNNNNYYAYRFGIVSTLDFCQNVDKIINEQIIIHFTYDYSHKNNITTTISASGNRQILRLMDWLYQDATIYLQRKHQKYQELKARIDDIDSRLNSPNNHKNQYV